MEETSYGPQHFYRDSEPPQPSAQEARRGAQSVASLLCELRDGIQTLFEKEVQLAKTEVLEQIRLIEQSLVKIAIGGVLLAMGGLFALWTINFGLTELYMMLGLSAGIAVWTAPLTVAIFTLLIGASIIAGGRADLAEASLKPKKTITTFHEDKAWAKEKVA